MLTTQYKDMELVELDESSNLILISTRHDPDGVSTIDSGVRRHARKGYYNWNIQLVILSKVRRPEAVG